jgi:hypothetical protein
MLEGLRLSCHPIYGTHFPDQFNKCDETNARSFFQATERQQMIGGQYF